MLHAPALSSSLSAYACSAEAAFMSQHQLHDRKRQRTSSNCSSAATSPALSGFQLNSQRTIASRRAVMASAAVTATMAAAGMDKRNSASTTSSSTLQTPGSSTFPSSLRSPSVYSPGFKESLKTPLTPPSAYLDFLKTMSPALQSPMLTSTSSRFNFNEKPSFEKVSSSGSTPATQPALSRNTSYSSDNSTASSSTTISEQSVVLPAKRTNRPESPRITIPTSMSSFAKPGPPSARTPRRLQIPQSPASAQSPLSATPWSASFSPREATDPEITGKPGRVSVRHVVTRTITYCRTPLEPAPRGKRRKLEEAIAALPLKPADVSIIVSEDEDTPKKLEDLPQIKQEPETAVPAAEETPAKMES